MIINTSCRTDIPAFYSKWLMNINEINQISFINII